MVRSSKEGFNTDDAREQGPPPFRVSRFAMLRMALAFLAVALTAVAIQFFGLAVVTAGLARSVFFIFMLLFLFCLGGHIYRGS